jgi:NAD-dependent SIR2 family protein deacetylase
MKIHYHSSNKVAHCSKCKKKKPLSDFHKDKSRVSGVQRYCKECKKKVDIHGSTEHVGKFLIYYLPKERYIGMTKNFKKRVQKHSENGKNVKYAFIVLKTKRMKLAHLVETLFHMVGFKGFRY